MFFTADLLKVFSDIKAKITTTISRRIISISFIFMINEISMYPISKNEKGEEIIFLFSLRIVRNRKRGKTKLTKIYSEVLWMNS